MQSTTTAAASHLTWRTCPANEPSRDWRTDGLSMLQLLLNCEAGFEGGNREEDRDPSTFSAPHADPARASTHFRRKHRPPPPSQARASTRCCRKHRPPPPPHPHPRPRPSPFSSREQNLPEPERQRFVADRGGRCWRIREIERAILGSDGRLCRLVVQAG